MTRNLAGITAGLAALAALGACASEMGLPRALPLPTLAVRAAPGTTAQDMAAAIAAASPRIALVTGPADTAWFAAVAEATSLRLSGPAMAAADLGIGFLGLEAVGDTSLELEHERGRFVLHDALYEVREGRFLDLLALRIDDAADVGPIMRSLIAYMATDIMPNAAVVLAVAVPSVAAGDAVGRALSPAYFDARGCGADPAAAGGIRLFFGPEAQVHCQTAVTDARAVGERVEARLVMGRR